MMRTEYPTEQKGAQTHSIDNCDAGRHIVLHTEGTMPRHRLRYIPALFLIIALSIQPGSANATSEPGLSSVKAHELIEKYLTERASRVTQAASSHAGKSLTAIPTTEDLQHRLTAEAKKLDEVRAQTLNTPSRGYIKAEVNITVDSLTPRGPAEVNVGATELTRLYFGHGDPNAPQFEGYRLEHEFTFVSQDRLWKLADMTAKLEGGGPPMPTQAGFRAPWRPDPEEGPLPEGTEKLSPAQVITAMEAGAKAPETVIDKLSGAGSSSVTPAYDYQAMYNYAAAHVFNYNPTYRRYSNDCTNFISQIMEAGGWQYVGFLPEHADDWDKWFYSILPEVPTSFSWAGGHNWGVFAQVMSLRTAPLEYVYQMLVTDVLQVDWDHPGPPDYIPGEPEGNIDHTMIVTGMLGTAGAATELYLTYHSNDRWNVPFWGSLLPGSDPEDVWYAHRT